MNSDFDKLTCNLAYLQSLDCFYDSYIPI